MAQGPGGAGAIELGNTSELVGEPQQLGYLERRPDRQIGAPS